MISTNIIDKITIFDKYSIVIDKLLYTDTNTSIMTGKYSGIDCVIKKTTIDKITGIRSRTLREVSFLKKINHSNIVSLYDVFCDDTYVYIILEKGIDDICNIDHNFIVHSELLNDVLSVLNYIENKGYIHGDMSFTNIVLFKKTDNKSTIFKLIDFGSATKLYRQDALKNPTSYISPFEIIHLNKDINSLPSNKIDSWAFGCLLYYVTTGRIINEDNMFEIITKINSNSTETCDMTEIKKFLMYDSNVRFSIGEYFNEKYNQNCIITKNIHDDDLFKKNTISDDLFDIQCQLVELFLKLNMINNISNENIFMTFKLNEQLFNKINSSDDFIVNCCCLFHITTKLITTKEFTCHDTVEIINSLTTSFKITSITHFNKHVINILIALNWNIDVETYFSLSQSLKDNLKKKYLSICLSVLCDKQMSIFSDKFLSEIIFIFVHNDSNDFIKTDQNKFLIKYVLQLIQNLFNKLTKVSTSTNNIYKLSQKYFNVVKKIQ